MGAGQAKKKKLVAKMQDDLKVTTLPKMYDGDKCATLVRFGNPAAVKKIFRNNPTTATKKSKNQAVCY